MATGSATVTANDGTSPYTYLWSTSGTQNSIINISAGTYYVTTTDNNGCSEIAYGNVNDENAGTLGVEYNNIVKP
ncbi:MAG: hypothetical protein HY738_07095 [Bacteroidia bacterium]|nr:hypothetical protein [Bacteroidia bacterium]